MYRSSTKFRPTSRLNDLPQTEGCLCQHVQDDVLLARKWTLRIAVTLSGDTKRHSELAKCLPGITQKVLTETLREMERTGIVERFVYPVVPPKVEYKLTEVGLELLKLSKEFASWFDTHHENIHKAKRIYDRQR